MSENESPKIILTIPKDKVKFEGEFAIVDVGLTIEEFVRAIMDFASSPKKMVAIEKTEVESRHNNGFPCTVCNPGKKKSYEEFMKEYEKKCGKPIVDDRRPE